jgi:hypothetical protein
MTMTVHNCSEQGHITIETDRRPCFLFFNDAELAMARNLSVTKGWCTAEVSEAGNGLAGMMLGSCG